MTSRILIADDSLTIQKVIGITLASSGYELVESLNEIDLFKKIQASHFDLVLLDFNLSDSQSGYDLAKKLSKIMPSAAIIVMLGTFDTVDDSQFEVCGISDKIVKPFESTKFIKKCRDLLEGKRPEVLTVQPEIAVEESQYLKTEDIDSWKVDAPAIHHHDTHPESNASDVGLASLNEDRVIDPLSSEIEGWGFTPGNALEEKFQKVFPPVIEEASETNILDRLQSSSQFVQFADESSMDTHVVSDATNPILEIPQNFHSNLASAIEEDVSVDTFWAVDEVVLRKSEEQEDISKTNLDEVTSDLTETVENFRHKELKEAGMASVMSESLSPGNVMAEQAFDQEAIIEKLKLAIRPMVEEIVKEYCRQSAEKIAWEVIPDLAENLIRKEIKDISQSLEN